MARPRSKFIARTYRILPDHDAYINAKAEEQEKELSEIVRAAIDLYRRRYPVHVPSDTEMRIDHETEDTTEGK